MAEMKHTPGPWIVGESKGTIAVGNKDKGVVRLFSCRDDAETQANAKLIAAANVLMCAAIAKAEGR